MGRWFKKTSEKNAVEKEQIITSPLLKWCMVFCAALALIVLCIDYLSSYRLIVMAIVMAIVIAVLTQCANKKVLIVCTAILVAVLYMAYLQKFVYEVQKNYDGSTCDVVFELGENPIVKYGGAHAEGKITNIDGKDVKYTALMYILDGSPSYKLGDVVATTADVHFVADDTFLNSGGIFITLVEGENSKLIGSQANSLRHLPIKLAIGFDQTIEKYMGKTQEAAVMTALVAGDRTDITKEQSRRFSVSGLSHIVAVSGMHITIISSIIILILGKKFGSVVAIFAVIAYAAISGFSPSAFRAAFMTSIMLSGFILRRNYDTMTGLGLALAVILVQNPFAIYNVGMSLSFAACLGIVTFSPHVSALTMHIVQKCKHAKKPVKFIVSSVGITLVAQVFATPILLMVFSRISVVGVVTNLFAVFPSTVAIALGYIGVLVEPLFPWLAAIVFKWLLMPIMSFIIWVSKVAESYNYASVSSENIYFIAFYVVSMLCIAYVALNRKKWRMPVFSLLLVGVVCIYGGVYDYKNNVYVSISGTGGSMAVMTSYMGENIGIGAGSWKKNYGGRFYENELFSRGGRQLDSLYLLGNKGEDVMAAHRDVQEVRVSRILAPEGTVFDAKQVDEQDVMYFSATGKVNTQGYDLGMVEILEGEYAAMMDFEKFRILMFLGKGQREFSQFVKERGIVCDVLIVPEAFAKKPEEYRKLCADTGAKEVIVEAGTYDSDIPLEKYFSGKTYNTREEKIIKYTIQKRAR